MRGTAAPIRFATPFGNPSLKNTKGADPAPTVRGSTASDAAVGARRAIGVTAADPGTLHSGGNGAIRCRCAKLIPGNETARPAATPNRQAIACFICLQPFPDYLTNPIFWIGLGVMLSVPLEGMELK